YLSGFRHRARSSSVSISGRAVARRCPLVALLRHRLVACQQAIELMHTERDWLDLESRDQGLSNFEEVNTSRRLGIHHESAAFDLGGGLVEELQPVPAHRLAMARNSRS